jgi:hypothetical protein
MLRSGARWQKLKHPPYLAEIDVPSWDRHSSIGVGGAGALGGCPLRTPGADPSD